MLNKSAGTKVAENVYSQLGIKDYPSLEQSFVPVEALLVIYKDAIPNEPDIKQEISEVNFDLWCSFLKDFEDRLVHFKKHLRNNMDE